MPAYVPPQRRNQPAESTAKSDDNDRSGNGDRQPMRDAGGDRGGDRGGYPRGNGDREDWKKRTEEPAGGEGGGDRDQGAGNGRFDSLNDQAPSRDDRGDRKGKGGGRDDDSGRRRDDGGENQKDGGDASKKGRGNAMAASGGGDWHRRDDGRRPGQGERSEVEVFGEPKEKRSSAGIDFDSYDAIPVQTTGQNVDHLKPISRFSDGKLCESLFDNLRRCGYDRPTPVQKHAIPIVAAGRDLMACAQTGSGKTCAFMVPCIESLLRSGPPARTGSNRRAAQPCGLVLAPTRELAIQIHAESLKFSFHTGIKSCIIYGGADMRDQKQEMERGCDILVATPGRLTDMVERNNISLGLVQFFILDEADRMLDMGFEPQVRQIVERTDMGQQCAHRRQSMMFSATFPREVQYMARDFMEDYVFITVGRVGSASELVKQYVVYAGDLKMKARSLEKAIGDYLPSGDLCVVFVETKRAADQLELDLHTAGVPVTAIHGDRSQSEREEALAAFKSGTNPVLVATDVAARGLDIPNVSLVVNFDMPKQIDDYVHRIGRTGRAGRKGTAVAFVNERCAYLPELGDLLSEAKQEVPIWFSELCRSSARRGEGKGAGKKSRYGGQDLRLEEQKEGTTPAPAGPAPGAPKANWNQPTRPANSYGNTGQDDAW